MIRFPMHLSSTDESNVILHGVPYKKHVILADVNYPTKLSIDRHQNNVVFCINADEFSDQSFHSVILNLERGLPFVVPGIRNGFASAVDHTNGSVYLGGSDGIYVYNHETKTIDRPALVSGIDIFDMFFQKYLYFVDTATQSLHILKDGKQMKVSNLDEHLIHHFVVDEKGNLYFVDPRGLYILKRGKHRAILLDDTTLHYRGVTLDKHGAPHFIAQDGIYEINRETGQIEKKLSLEKGFGLAFDKNNNIVYSLERELIRLIRC